MLRSRLLIFKAFLEGVPSVFDVLLFVCCVGFVSFVCFLDVGDGVCVCVDWLSGWHVNLHWQYFSHQFPIVLLVVSHQCHSLLPVITHQCHCLLCLLPVPTPLD